EAIGTDPQMVEQVLATVLCDGEEAHHGRALVDDLEAEMPGEVRLVDREEGQGSLEVARRIVPVRLRAGDHAVDLRQVLPARPPHAAGGRRRLRGGRHRGGHLPCHTVPRQSRSSTAWRRMTPLDDFGLTLNGQVRWTHPMRRIALAVLVQAAVLLA